MDNDSNYLFIQRGWRKSWQEIPKMAPPWAEITWEEYGVFLNSFNLEVKRLIQRLERIKVKIDRNEEFVLFKRENSAYLSKSLIGTTQDCYELYWTNPGSNTPQNNSCAATYLLSQNPFK